MGTVKHHVFHVYFIKSATISKFRHYYILVLSGLTLFSNQPAHNRNFL